MGPWLCWLGVYFAVGIVLGAVNAALTIRVARSEPDVDETLAFVVMWPVVLLTMFFVWLFITYLEWRRRRG